MCKAHIIMTNKCPQTPETPKTEELQLFFLQMVSYVPHIEFFPLKFSAGCMFGAKMKRKLLGHARHL